MAFFRRKPIRVEAVQLRWDNWSEMCKFAGVGRFENGLPEGCFVDDEGRVTLDGNGRIGLRIPTPIGPILASEGDWLVRGADGELWPFKRNVFENTFETAEPLSAFRVNYEPSEGRYPNLWRLFAALSKDNPAKRELQEFIADEHAAAVRFVQDVKAEDLAKARSDERERIAAASRIVDNG